MNYGEILLNKKLIEEILKNLKIDNEVNFSNLENDEIRIDKDFEAIDYSQLIQIREYKQGFTNRLLYRYSKPIQELEIFSELCKTIGHNTYNRLELEADNKEEAIRRLHQKSTLICSEIIYLIKGGYPAAALSRWRTLFETSVVAIFLAINDDEVAKRYIDYTIIESKKELNSYLGNNCYLGFEEIPEHEINVINARYDEILKTYGKNFKNDYGWASKVLNNNKPNLHNLMDFTNSQYMKPFYKFSNNYIHGGAKSLFYNLGYIDGVLGESTIASSSNIGFTDPAQLCALSYFNSTLAFLSVAPTEEDLMLLIDLYYKINRIANKFSQIENEIIKEEADE